MVQLEKSDLVQQYAQVITYPVNCYHMTAVTKIPNWNNFMYFIRIFFLITALWAAFARADSTEPSNSIMFYRIMYQVLLSDGNSAEYADCAVKIMQQSQMIDFASLDNLKFIDKDSQDIDKAAQSMMENFNFADTACSYLKV